MTDALFFLPPSFFGVYYLYRDDIGSGGEFSLPTPESVGSGPGSLGRGSTGGFGFGR